MAKLSDSSTVDVKPILTGQTMSGPGVVKADEQLVVTKETLKLMLSEFMQEMKSELRVEMQTLNTTSIKSNSAPQPITYVLRKSSLQRDEAPANT